MFWCSAASPTSCTRSRRPHGRLLRVFLTKRDGLAKKGESVVFGRLLPHPSPLPQLPPLQTRCRCPFGHLQRISLTTRDEHADFGVSVAFSCVPSKPTRKRVPIGRVFVSTSFPPHQNTNVPTWARWWSVLHSQTRKCAPYGRVFVSGYIPSTSGHP